MTNVFPEIKTQQIEYLQKNPNALIFLKRWIEKNSAKAKNIFNLKKEPLNLQTDAQRSLVSAVTFDPEFLKTIEELSTSLKSFDINFAELISQLKNRKGPFFFIEDIDKLRPDDTKEQAAALWFWHLIGKDPKGFFSRLLKNDVITKYYSDQFYTEELNSYLNLAEIIAGIALEVRNKLLNEKSNGDEEKAIHMMNSVQFQEELSQELTAIWKQLV
ncbi:MAG: hypothetical protein ABI721_01350 [Candidatus Dojkabacteria bacterium]